MNIHIVGIAQLKGDALNGINNFLINWILSNAGTDGSTFSKRYRASLQRV